MAPTRCRPATADDLDRICELGQEVNAIHHEAWPHVFAPPSQPGRDRELWLQSLRNPSGAVFVAEVDGGVAGFLSLQVVQDASTLLQPLRFARIGTVAVSGPMRGRGIGRALMAQAEDWALRQGASEIRLNVWTFNEGALRLYAELGYESRSLVLGKRLEPREP